MPKQPPSFETDSTGSAHSLILFLPVRRAENGSSLFYCLPLKSSWAYLPGPAIGAWFYHCDHGSSFFVHGFSWFIMAKYGECVDMC